MPSGFSAATPVSAAWKYSSSSNASLLLAAASDAASFGKCACRSAYVRSHRECLSRSEMGMSSAQSYVSSICATASLISFCGTPGICAYTGVMRLSRSRVGFIAIRPVFLRTMCAYIRTSCPSWICCFIQGWLNHMQRRTPLSSLTFALTHTMPCARCR